MPVLFPDILQHANSNLGLVDSNFVVGGIRTKVADLNALYAIVDGTTATVDGQVKDYATMVYVESAGTYYVLKDRAQIANANGWETLSSLIDVATSPSTITVSANSDSQSRPVLFASGTTGVVSVYTDPGITYNPSTDLLTVTTTAAQKWSTARTVTFAGGDVTGSFSIDGSADVSNVALTIAANSVALGTDTTGNYVASIANGSGITGGATGSEGATLTLALDINGLTAQTTLQDADTFAFYDVSETANRKATADNIRDYVLGGVSGAITIDSSGVATIGNNQVALGTQTTGNYIATAAAGTGISVSGSGSENATITITNTDLGSSQNIFKNFTDGTTTAAADTNNDTFKFRGSNGVTVTVGNDDATHGDNLLISLSSVPVTALENNQITIASANGITGGSVALGQTLTLSAAVQAIQGTSNQITANTASGTVTLSLPSDITTPGSLTVTGDLTVNGTTTYINTTNAQFKDSFLHLNRPPTVVNTSLLTYAGLFVYDQTDNTTAVTEANSPGIRYDYSNNKWQLRQDNAANAQDNWVDIITTANQTSIASASIAETLQGTNTTKYVVPDGLRSWTAYSTENIGVTFPGSGVSNAAGTTEVQYAKTVKATATVTAGDVSAGYFAIYHGLGNLYPIVNVYVADGNDYYQVIPKLVIDDANNIKVYINGMIATTTYYIGITG